MPESTSPVELEAALGLEVLHRFLGLPPEDAVYRRMLPKVVEGLLKNGDIAARIASLEVPVWVRRGSDGSIAGRSVNSVLGVPRRRQNQGRSEGVNVSAFMTAARVSGARDTSSCFGINPCRKGLGSQLRRRILRLGLARREIALG